MANPTELKRNTGQVYYGTNATTPALQTKATSALLIASGAEVLATGQSDVLEVSLVNSTAAQSGKLIVAEFSEPVPTVANMIAPPRENDISATDQTGTTDRVLWGLTTGTEYAAKQPIRLQVTRNHYAMIAVSSTTGGTWYARVNGRRAEDIVDLDAGDAADSAVAVVSSVLPSGASTATNQTAVQANAGSDASKAVAVQGVAGGKSLSTTDTNSAAIKAAAENAVLPLKDTWPKKFTTGASALLSATLTFPAGTFRLTLVPVGSETIYMEKTTAAAATSPIIPPGGVSFVVTKSVADALAVMSTNASALSVFVNQ
jgi:hypothetical protein